MTGANPLPSAANARPAPLCGDCRQQDQRQARTLQPAGRGGGRAITFGQPQRAVLNAREQIAAGAAGQAIGFLVFQGARVFLAQAHGLGQPECLQGFRAVTRRPVEPVSLEHNRWNAGWEYARALVFVAMKKTLPLSLIAALE